MGSLPRPLLAVLVAVIAAFAAWTLVLNHSSSPSAPGATATSPVVAPSTHTTTTTGATHRHGALSAAQAKALAKARAARVAAQSLARRQAAAAAHRVAVVDAALASDKVVALLFYNPAGPDDQADRDAVAAIPFDHGRVVRVAVPVTEIAHYTTIVDQVPIEGTPALVVIDTHHRAQLLTGFADQLEYDQLVADALLASK